MSPLQLAHSGINYSLSLGFFFFFLRVVVVVPTPERTPYIGEGCVRMVKKQDMLPHPENHGTSFSCPQ